MIEELWKFSLGTIERRPLRTILTMVGIFLGIAMIVALFSLGNGLQSAITAQFEQMGTDKIIVQPKGSIQSASGETSTAALTDDDLQAMRQTRGVDEAAGAITRAVKIEHNDVVRFTTLFALPNAEGSDLMKEVFFFEIEEGRDLQQGDGKKVVLGSRFKTANLYDGNVKLRDTILINDEEFKVVGFYESIGNTADDQTVGIPLDTAQEMFDTETWNFLVAKAAASAEPSEVADAIEEKLRNTRGVKEGKEDFTVTTAEEFLESVGSILLIVNIFLIGVAGISLVVGSIGILNTMYTAVLERTQEIGVMKAIGAKKQDIITIFLMESALLGALGGLAGVLLGFGVAKLVEFVVGQSGNTIIQADISIVFALGMIVFSAGIGAIAGTWPAYRASQLKPTEALRYE